LFQAAIHLKKTEFLSEEWGAPQGDKGKAGEYYGKASTAVAHNPPAAYAVPLAKKKPASLPS
jgi:hypothetical protein